MAAATTNVVEPAAGLSTFVYECFLACDASTVIREAAPGCHAADAVTRRSILGTSGRIRFLSSGNASWLLMNPADGAIAGGGQANLADVMSFGLDTGKAEFTPPQGWIPHMLVLIRWRGSRSGLRDLSPY